MTIDASSFVRKVDEKRTLDGYVILSGLHRASANENVWIDDYAAPAPAPKSTTDSVAAPLASFALNAARNCALSAIANSLANLSSRVFKMYSSNPPALSMHRSAFVVTRIGIIRSRSSLYTRFFCTFGDHRLRVLIASKRNRHVTRSVHGRGRREASSATRERGIKVEDSERRRTCSHRPRSQCSRI